MDTKKERNMQSREPHLATYSQHQQQHEFIDIYDHCYTSLFLSPSMLYNVPFILCVYIPITMTISSMPLFSIPQCKEPMTLSPTTPHILPLSLCNLISQRSHTFCSPFPCLFMSSCHIYNPYIYHLVIPKIRH